MRGRTALAAMVAAMVFAVTGCSQLDGLAPVSGGPITTLRAAANDVLLQNGIKILVAPQCIESGETFTCAGTTLDNEPITVTGTASDPQTMTVTVGTALLYEGDVRAVIEQAAEVPQ